ncbi:carbon-phosphorus lyase complex subunit PhnI [Anaerorhabdus sp.]|uniref:carbon-phosphorus lyase complex subunit PhnI n=1 Tax=Anaerorhabdus sp. TaxID=1872524 RepID=UPI002FCB4968
MAYVAVKGGQKAIEKSIERLKYKRLEQKKSIKTEDIEASFRLLIDQVLSESSLYSRELAAIALKQAEGSVEEAVFLLRAYRSTLPRKYYSRIAESSSMFVERRISAAFKDIPKGQILGASFDYTHRLVDFELKDETDEDAKKFFRKVESKLKKDEAKIEQFPKVVDYLKSEGLIESHEPDNTEPKDTTKETLKFPASRSERLQILQRGMSQAVIGLGYASLRGYGAVHPTVAELRVGQLPLTIENPNNPTSEEDSYSIGSVEITEVESLVPVTKLLKDGSHEINFEIGYGITLGQNETKAIAMSILDQCLERKDEGFATSDEEFVLYHVDSIEATGFISHLKLPHYVTFQAKLNSARKVKGNSDEEEI